ncbi:MAG: hypothetical protein WAM60_18485 [Candidatus Promineifilaceae bacterium]
MKTQYKFGFIFLLVFLLFPSLVFAQDEPALKLSLSRDNGYGLGSQMQGHFSYRVTGPDNLVRVEYLMDGEVIGESTEQPFRFRFVTDNFELGSHQMSAVGYTADGQTLESNTIRGEFVSPQVTNKFLFGVIGFVVVIVLARFLFFRDTSGKKKKGYGVFGGAVCANCGRPFAIHWWSPHLLTTRFDRCPHCGKWQGTRPATPDQLAAAEALEAEPNSEPLHPESELEAEEKLRKKLDDSRYEDT